MLTQRLGSDTEKDFGFIDGLIQAIKENPGACDEVWLASDYGFPKLEVHQNTAECLKRVAEQFRGAGVRVSLQISNTIGHGQYMCLKDCTGLVYEGSSAEKMVGPDGTVADYCFCWNGKNFRKYIKAMLQAYAGLNPYCIWFDDDLRASNHDPVIFGCFCDECMEKFNLKYNSSFAREEFVWEINYGDISWREKYVEFLRCSLGEFAFFMAETVREISQDSYMGLQYGAHGGYTGYGFRHILDALYKASGRVPKTRPGGGAYSGHNPNEFLEKAYSMNWQNCMLPDYVSEMRPEIENLPDVVFGKSIANTCFETTVYLANGNTAMSYAMLMNDFESMQWHKQAFHHFARLRHYWERLAEANKNTRQCGIKMAFSRDMWKAQLKDTDDPFSWMQEPYLSGFNLWSCTAIPIYYSKQNEGGVFLLHPDNLRCFTDDDIRALLEKPVLTDGKCLEMLEKKGFGDSFGASSRPVDASMLYERYTDHELNLGISGNREWRTCFVQNAYHYAIRDKNGTTEPFGVYASHTSAADMIDANAKHPYGVADAIVTTKQGAKWAVFGHFLWNNIISLSRRNQIIGAADYISKHDMPAILESPIQAVLLPRENEEGKVTSISIINTTVGETEPLTLRVRRPAGMQFSFMSQNSIEIPLSFTQEKNDYIIEVPSIAPWSVGSIFVGQQ